MGGNIDLIERKYACAISIAIGKMQPGIQDYGSPKATGTKTINFLFLFRR